MKVFGATAPHLAALALSLLAAACGGGDGDGTGNDDDGGTGGTGSGQGSVGPGAGGGGPSGECFQAFPVSWTLLTSSGPSQCKSFEPIECDVDQDGCTVTLDCPTFGGSASVEIDADGITESTQVPLGDGVVAECHAEFSEAFGTSVGDVFSMTLVCSAMGIQCEYGESKVFVDDP